MTLQLVGYGGWRSPYTALYGGGSGNTIAAGKLTLDNRTGSTQVLNDKFPNTEPIKCVTAAECSFELKSGDVADERLIFDGVVSTFPSTVRLEIRLEYVSATDFKFNLTDDDVLGDSFSTKTDFKYGHGAAEYDIRLITDGTDWILDVDGVEQIRFADARKLDLGESVRFRSAGVDDSGNSSCKFGPAALWAYSDPDTERPSADVASAMLALDGESADGSHGDFTKPDDAPDDPDFNDVNDYESGAPVDGEGAGGNNRHPPIENATQRQAYTTGGYTIANDIQALIIHDRTQVGNGLKGATQNAYIFDGTDIIDAAPYTPVTTYVNKVTLFETAPDGGAWSTAEFGIVELGCKAVIIDQGNERTYLSAIFGEVIDYSLDPVSTPGRTRRTHIAFF